MEEEGKEVIDVEEAEQEESEEESSTTTTTTSGGQAPKEPKKTREDPALGEVEGSPPDNVGPKDLLMCKWFVDQKWRAIVQPPIGRRGGKLKAYTIPIKGGVQKRTLKGEEVFLLEKYYLDVGLYSDWDEEKKWKENADVAHMFSTTKKSVEAQKRAFNALLKKVKIIKIKPRKKDKEGKKEGAGKGKKRSRSKKFIDDEAADQEEQVGKKKKKKKASKKSKKQVEEEEQGLEGEGEEVLGEDEPVLTPADALAKEYLGFPVEMRPIFGELQAILDKKAAMRKEYVMQLQAQPPTEEPRLHPSGEPVTPPSTYSSPEHDDQEPYDPFAQGEEAPTTTTSTTSASLPPPVSRRTLPIATSAQEFEAVTVQKASGQTPTKGATDTGAGASRETTKQKPTTSVRPLKPPTPPTTPKPTQPTKPKTPPKAKEKGAPSKPSAPPTKPPTPLPEQPSKKPKVSSQDARKLLMQMANKSYGTPSSVVTEGKEEVEDSDLVRPLQSVSGKAGKRKQLEGDEDSSDDFEPSPRKKKKAPTKKAGTSKKKDKVPLTGKLDTPTPEDIALYMNRTKKPAERSKEDAKAKAQRLALAPLAKARSAAFRIDIRLVQRPKGVVCSRHLYQGHVGQLEVVIEARGQNFPQKTIYLALGNIPREKLEKWKVAPQDHLDDILEHAATQPEGENLVAVGGMHTTVGVGNVITKIEAGTVNNPELKSIPESWLEWPVVAYFYEDALSNHWQELVALGNIDNESISLEVAWVDKLEKLLELLLLTFTSIQEYKDLAKESKAKSKESIAGDRVYSFKMNAMSALQVNKGALGHMLSIVCHEEPIRSLYFKVIRRETAPLLFVKTSSKKKATKKAQQPMGSANDLVPFLNLPLPKLQELLESIVDGSLSLEAAKRIASEMNTFTRMARKIEEVFNIKAGNPRKSRAKKIGKWITYDQILEHVPSLPQQLPKWRNPFSKAKLNATETTSFTSWIDKVFTTWRDNRTTGRKESLSRQTVPVQFIAGMVQEQKEVVENKKWECVESLTGGQTAVLVINDSTENLKSYLKEKEYLIDLVLMDLPMGLKKFPGDDRVATEAEIDSWVASIEHVNRATQTVFFCITPLEQIFLVAQIIKKHGYTASEQLFIHKQWKSDQVLAGGFVSSVLHVVVGYKDKAATWSGASIPEEGVEKLMWRQNLWTLYKPTKAQVDSMGHPVNQCPQDPILVDRLIQMFRPKVIFSHGEGAGWGAPVALMRGVDYICTEVDSYTYGFLVKRLQTVAGEAVTAEGKQQQLYRNVHRFTAMTARADAAKEEFRKAIATALAKTDVFDNVGDQVKEASVEALAEIPTLDIHNRQELISEAKKMIKVYSRSIQLRPVEKEGVEEAIDLSQVGEDEDDAGEGDDDGNASSSLDKKHLLSRKTPAQPALLSSLSSSSASPLALPVAILPPPTLPTHTPLVLPTPPKPTTPAPTPTTTLPPIQPSIASSPIIHPPSQPTSTSPPTTAQPPTTTTTTPTSTLVPLPPTSTLDSSPSPILQSPLSTAILQARVQATPTPTTPTTTPVPTTVLPPRPPATGPPRPPRPSVVPGQPRPPPPPTGGFHR